MFPVSSFTPLPDIDNITFFSTDAFLAIVFRAVAVAGRVLILLGGCVGYEYDQSGYEYYIDH